MASVGTPSLAASLAQPDDNMVNGQVYTFVFHGTNVTVAVLENAINDYAPNFLQSVIVTIQASSASGTVYYVQFQYEGDGSDVISDVANSLIAAFSQESNGAAAENFVQAVTGAAASVALPAPNAAGVSYWNTTSITSFFQNLLGTPVTSEQLAARQTSAAAQISAVAASPGGQVPAATAVTAASAAQQITASNADQAAIATQANATAPTLLTQILVILAVVVGIAFFARSQGVK